MLSPHELELLTTHVDGELSAAQRRQVEGLLERSGEARDMLHWLEADASRLRAMPRRAAPADLSAGVLEEIGRLAQRTNGRAKPAGPPPRVLRFPVWGGVAAAAAVLLAVGVGSFLLNWPKGDPDKGPDGFAGKGVEKDKGELPGPERGAIVKFGPDREDGKSIAKAPDHDGKGKASPGKTAPDKGKETKSPGGVLAATDVEPQPKLERVELDLPTVARLHELDKPEAGKALTERLSKLKTARVELTTKDGLRAFDRLKAAMAAKKINLHIDPATEPRLRKTLVKSDVVVFVENVKPEDIVELLREVVVADRKGDPKFDGAVVVKELGRWDRKDLMDLLGLDPLVNRPAARGKPGIDIRKELHEQTTREVVAALDGQGLPRPGVEAGCHAYVSHLPSSKGRPAELTRFLNLRQPPKEGTIQVLLLVLRHVG